MAGPGAVNWPSSETASVPPASGVGSSHRNGGKKMRQMGATPMGQVEVPMEVRRAKYRATVEVQTESQELMQVRECSSAAHAPTAALLTHLLRELSLETFAQKFYHTKLGHKRKRNLCFFLSGEEKRGGGLGEELFARSAHTPNRLFYPARSRTSHVSHYA